MPKVSAINKRLTTTKDYVRKNKLFMQNEPKFRKSQVNVTALLTREYVQMDTWSIRKNEPKRTQNEPKRTQNKPKSQKGQNERNYLSNNELRTKNYERWKKTKPIQTQTNPNKPNSWPPSVWREKGPIQKYSKFVAACDIRGCGCGLYVGGSANA